jgi:glycosyltransferase involved in cell wall biosynthesis
MRICVLQPSLDSFKGGNHLPLFGAVPDTEFTVITGKMKLDGHSPKNVQIIPLGLSLGSYYYGRADKTFAQAILQKYPITDPFWTQFDVIHLNQTLSPLLLELQKTGVPVIYAVHHPVTADLQVALEETSALEGVMWKLRYRSLIKAQQNICMEASHILTVSNTVKKRLIDNYTCAAEKIHIVPNGVDTEEFAAGEAPSHDIIALGSFLHPRKGFRYLLEAYRSLAEAGYTIADVGRRSAEQVAALKKIRQVKVYGTVPQAKLVSLLRQSRVLLSTSLYEGFGLSLIESLSCGHPCVAFNAGAVSEVLGPIDPQLVVPIRDVPSLVTHAKYFLTLPIEKQQSLGEEYRQKVRGLYSIEKSAEALHSLYTLIQAEK